MSEEIKRCPFCGEEILAIANKCKHCGSNLEEGASSVPAAIPRQAADYGMFLLAIPVIATLLIWFWVSSMNLLQSPSSTMDMIMLATILGTAIVAAMEASSAGMKSDSDKGTYSPTAWFFIITFLWVVGYPVYLFKRKHFGLADRLVAGILVALIFVGSWGLMYSVIEREKAKIQNGLEQMTKQMESLVRPEQDVVSADVMPTNNNPQTESFAAINVDEVKNFSGLNLSKFYGPDGPKKKYSYATQEQVEIENFMGTCGHSSVQIQGVDNIFDNEFSMDNGEIIVSSGSTKQLNLRDVLSDHNGIACVATKAGGRLLIWSSCSGSSCGGANFSVIDPDKLVNLAPNSCDAQCASRVLGSQSATR